MILQVFRAATVGISAAVVASVPVVATVWLLTREAEDGWSFWGHLTVARYIGANPPPGDIVLIGYSMGGLVAREMIANNYLSTLAPLYTGGKVAGLITLGSPHLGYPWDPADDGVMCYLLNHDMAGGWSPVQNSELPALGGSTFFDQLRQSWGGTSVPYWLAAAGTAYNQSLRAVALAALPTGCISSNSPVHLPYSDGVVCRDSALYQEPPGFSGWVTPPLPNVTPWSDPFHNYVHTRVPIFGGNASLFGANITTTTLYELYNPPAYGNLVATIVSTINAH